MGIKNEREIKKVIKEMNRLLDNLKQNRADNEHKDEQPKKKQDN